MTAAAPFSASEYLRRPPEFSLVLGGPLFQLLRRAHLSDAGLHLERRRVIVISLLAWLPLLVLSALGGKAYGESVKVPFLLDVEVHVRFLVAIPLLLIAEVVVHERMRLLARQFLDRELVPPATLTRFDQAIESTLRLRNSVAAEVLLLVVVYVVGVQVIWREYLTLQAPTWYATPSPGGSTLTFAGFWYGYVSLPMFQFLLLRWYFRIFLWARLMWKMSRIELSLVPTHPDQCAGVAFLGSISTAFMPLAVAHGAVVAGQLASRILHLGATLPQFSLEIAAVVALVLIISLGPLLFFMQQLRRAKIRGNREYGILAERYVREFDTKWLRGGAPDGEPLIGSADIQSLADLNSSYGTVRNMSIIPFGRQAVTELAVGTLVPIAPLLLTMMPLEELIKRLVGALF